MALNFVCPFTHKVRSHRLWNCSWKTDFQSNVLAQTFFLISPSSALLPRAGAETPSGLIKWLSKIKIHEQVDTSIHHSGGKCYISRRIFDSCLRTNISHQGLSSLSHHRHYMLAPSPQLHPQSLTFSSTVSSYTPFPTRHMRFVYQGYTRTHLLLSISRVCVPPAAFYSWSSSSLGPRCLWTLPCLSQEG